MFRKLLHTVVATSISTAPVGASASEQYFFRYKAPLTASLVPPQVDDTEYGIGNDIVAYYVAPIGYDFTKKIPVATQDVVEWRKDSGEIPAGIGLDTTSGIFTGIPAAEDTETTLFHGYDRSGNRIARAEIHFTVFEPVGVPSVVDFYAHTGTYFYGEIPNPDGVTVHTWTPIVTYADGMSMMNSAFQGTPEKAGTYGVAWRGFDYLGREVAFAYGDFLVEDGPVVEEIADSDIRRIFGDQTVDKGRGETFLVTPTVRHALGPVTYKLIPETSRPGGLVFSSVTGVVGGVHSTFETSASFRIEARDSYDGTTGLSTPFTLTTLPAELDLSQMPNLTGVVGTAYNRRLTAANVVPGATWAILQGTLPAGLTLNGQTGVISGTPLKTEVQTGIIIGVSGVGMIAAQSGEFEFRIHSEPLSASGKPLDVRIGTPFATEGLTLSAGGSEGYSVTSASLRDGLALDDQTGSISSSEGFDTAGSYDQTLTINAGTRRLNVWQVLRAYNPLEITYGNHEIARYEWLNARGTTPSDSIIGTARYSIKDTDGDALPGWLLFNSKTGRLNGTPTGPETADVTYGPYVVTLKDDQDEVNSAPFTVKVNERAGITLNVFDRDVQRYVGNGYRIATAAKGRGGIAYSLSVKPANWPTSLRVTADGWLTGRTGDPVGTVYSGIVIKAVDGEGFEASSDPFDLTVMEPESLGGLFGYLDQTLEWTEGRPLTGTLPPLRNGFGTVTYAFDSASNEVSLADASNGSFAGTAGAPGTRELGFTIDDETVRDPAKGKLTLKINPKLETTDPDTYSLNRAARFDQKIPAVSGGTAPFTYSLSGTLPKGVHFSNGRIYGTPEEEGSFPVSITVTDKAGATAVASFALDVGAPLPFEIEYPATPLIFGKSGAYGILLAPSVKNAMPTASSVTWNGATGTLPAGVRLSGGSFVGTPAETGRFPGIVVSATDGEGRPATATVDLVVTRDGEVVFDDITFRHRKGLVFTDTVAASNVVDPVAYSSTDPSGLPHDLVLNAATGAITGSFSETGSYTVGITATDDMARTGDAQVTFEIVGDLAVSAEDLVFKQYSPSPGTAATAENAVGQPTYALVEGSLPADLSIDPATGAVVGTPDDKGTYSDLVIEATDADGTTARSNVFTVSVEERAPLVLTAPTTLSLKRFSTSNFASTTTDEIPPVKYDVTPDLPNGLTLSENSGAITGSSDEIVPQTVYTLSAIDSKAGALGTDVAQFTLSVAERDPLEISGAETFEFQQHQNGSVSYTAINAVDGAAFSITPALPDGLSLDPTTGTISGTSHAVSAPAQYVIEAVDSKGGTLGTSQKTATLSVKERAPLEISGPDSHEFQQYFEGTVTYDAVSKLGSARFSVSPSLPDGLTLDEGTGSISGTASEKMPPTQHTLSVADDYDTTSKTISITVGDRVPLEFATSAEQATLLNHEYFLALAVDNVVGDSVVWQHVSGGLPAGISFDASTGTFSGTPSAFGVTSNVTIRATDGFGGSANRTFVFTVLQDGTPISLTASGGTTRVGQPFTLSAPQAGNLVGEAVWTLSAGTTGLTIDPKTGELKGTPSSTFSSDITISVSDASGRSVSQTIQVTSVPKISVTAPTSLDLVFNYAPPTGFAAKATDNVGTVVWSISGNVPTGLSVDPKTGAIVGKPQQLGTFSPVYVTASDTLPGSTSSLPITIKVVMNEDPLELAVTDFVTKVGHPVQTVTPAYANNLGPVTFFSTDLEGTGLSLDPVTGVLSGNADAVADRFINISVKDSETARVTSRPLHLQVLPDMQITLPAQVTITALSNITPIAPTRNYVVGTATWEPIDVSVNKLPEGITFDTTTGTFRGLAKEIGTFGPFTVASTDSIGDRGVSNSFIIKSNPGAEFLGLADGTLPEGSDTPYQYDVRNNLATIIGIDDSRLVWTMSATAGQAVPPGLTLSGGVISGTPTTGGTFTFTVTLAKNNGSIPAATRVYTIKVKIAPTLAFTPSTAGYISTSATTLTFSHLKRKTGDVIDLAPGSGPLPPGFAIVPAGNTYQLVKAIGTDDDVGVYRNVNFRVTDVDGLFGETGPKTIIIRPKDYLAYPELTISQRTGGPQIDTGLPAPSAGKKIADVKFAFSRDITGGNLQIDTGTGRITGNVTANGYNTVLVTESYDGITIRTFSYRVTMTTVVLAMSQDNIAVAKGFSFTSTAPKLENPVSGAKFTLTGDVPAGLTVNEATGVISGTTNVTPGTYDVALVFSDDFASISQPLKIRVHGDTGYKKWKFVATFPEFPKGYYGGINEITYFDENGANVVPLRTSIKTLGGSFANVLDGDDTTGFTMSGGTPAEISLTLDFPTKTSIKKLRVYSGCTYTGVSYQYWQSAKIQGSDDGTTWVDVGTISRGGCTGVPPTTTATLP